MAIRKLKCRRWHFVLPGIKSCGNGVSASAYNKDIQEDIR